MVSSVGWVLWKSDQSGLYSCVDSSEDGRVRVDSARVPQELIVVMETGKFVPLL